MSKRPYLLPLVSLLILIFSVIFVFPSIRNWNEYLAGLRLGAFIVAMAVLLSALNLGLSSKTRLFSGIVTGLGVAWLLFTIHVYFESKQFPKEPMPRKDARQNGSAN
jgi:hypothetical protein